MGVEKKLKDKKTLQMSRLTPAEIQQRIEENIKIGNYADPTTRKLQVIHELRDTTDPEVIEQLNDEIEVLNGIIYKTHTALVTSKEAERIAKITKRHEVTNQQNRSLHSAQEAKAMKEQAALAIKSLEDVSNNKY